MVQLARETKLDPFPGNHWDDLASSLSGHTRQFWFRFCTGVSRQGQLDCRVTVRHQYCGEPDLHADSIWFTESSLSGLGHHGRLGNDHLVRRRHLAALQVGLSRPDSVFRLGITCDCVATVDYSLELGPMTRRVWERKKPICDESQIGL